MMNGFSADSFAAALKKAGLYTGMIVGIGKAIRKDDREL
jgi:hypothetical protein